VKQVKEAMLAVFQDVVYSQLHPKVKHQFEEAIRRFDQLNTVFSSNSVLIAQKVREINEAQKARFINFKKPPARFLSREVDRYPKCSNA
jgi:hypothetical protein